MLIERVPNHHRGAFVFARGLSAAFRPPFADTAGQVFPIRGGPEVEPALRFLPFEETPVLRWEGEGQGALRLRQSAPPAEQRRAVEGRVHRWDFPSDVTAGGALEVQVRAPEHPGMTVGVGRAFAALGRRAEARSRYLAALDGPFAADAHFGLGDLARESEEPEEALAVD